MERYRRALAEYMAEQQPVRMAEGGLTQSDYDTFVNDVYGNVVANYADDPEGGNQYIADRIVESIAGFAGIGFDPDMDMLINSIESIGSGTYGQDRSELDNVLYLADQALEPLGYDLGTYTPIVIEPEPTAPDSEPDTAFKVSQDLQNGLITQYEAEVRLAEIAGLGPGDPGYPVDPVDPVVPVDPVDTTPELLTLAQSDYDAYTQGVFDRATAGQITPEQIIEEISSGFAALQDQGYNVEADKLRSSVNTVWNRSSTGADVDTEINNALFSLDEILEPAGLDIGDYTFIEPPPPPVEPPPPVDPGVPTDTTSMTGLADTVVALTDQAQTTGDYTTLNQFLQDNNIDTNGLRLLFPDISDADFQSVLDAGATPSGYTQPVVEPPVATPTVEDIPDDFYRGFQKYYQGLDPESRGSLASELEDYIAKNVDIGGILASANAKEYDFGGEYSGEFEPETYLPGLPFYSYRTPEATGIDVSSPFGQYTLSQAESQKSAVAPKNVATFQQQAFGSLPALERESMIRDVVNTMGLEAPDLPELMTEFGVTPEELSLAAGLPFTALPQGIQGVTDFATRTIPGTTPATFIPQVGDITPLSGVSSGLPSLGVQPLPTYTPISFGATPEQVAAATIGAMNAAEAGQS